MKKAKLLFGFLAALVIFSFNGCKDMDNYDEDQQKQVDESHLGRLVIKLTDAPFPFEMIESATVNIVKVEIRRVSEGDEDGYPFMELPLPDDSNEFNLLELRNGVTADLVDMEIEPGNYDLIRLYVDEAALKVKDGDEYRVKVPSGAQTGIKIFIKPALKVVSQLTSDVVLDFNLEKSFVLKGNAFTPAGIKGFNFKPVVKAVNNTTEGTLAGEVYDEETEDLLPGISVWIERADTLVASTSTDELGKYALSGITAGYYDVIAGSAAFYNDTVEGVEIVEGNLTIQDFILTPIKGDLEGVVKDLDADTVLPGATVWIEQDDVEIASAVTDEDGYYLIPDIRVGFYDVIVSIEGFVNDTVEGVEIVDGTVTVDFGLTPVTGTLEGVVKDAADEELLKGAKVWIEQEEVEIASAETDDEGYYIINDIALGFYNVIASMENYVNDTVKDVEIVDGILTVNFELELKE